MGHFLALASAQGPTQGPKALQHAGIVGIKIGMGILPQIKVLPTIQCFLFFLCVFVLK
jgi:hypothetical protein